MTRQAGGRSRDSQVKVEYTQVIVSESERYRKQTENILIYKADRFNRTIQENEASLADLTSVLDEMQNQIPELNQQVAIIICLFKSKLFQSKYLICSF